MQISDLILALRILFVQNKSFEIYTTAIFHQRYYLMLLYEFDQKFNVKINKPFILLQSFSKVKFI